MSETTSTPTDAQQRIVTLDVVRGVALLGILLLNIVGMGMLSTAYFYPLGGGDGLATSLLDQRVWMGTELFFEGSMRALFSMLFGAGVILFTSKKSGALHFRRTFWLLVFGLIDGYLLQWKGDILVVYAVAGALLFFFRNASARRLLFLAGALLVLLFLARGAAVIGLGMGQDAQKRVAIAELIGEKASADDVELAISWNEFLPGVVLPKEQQRAELEARRKNYVSAFRWNAAGFSEVLLFALPSFLVWDAIVMMALGMALYRYGVLQGQSSNRFYLTLAAVGIGSGLLINGFELQRSIDSNFDPLISFSFLQPTYDLGRIGLGLGYMALTVWWVKRGYFTSLRNRLAAVGRMALTNYLMHSAIALLLFTGAGFGLVGKLDRWQLYPVVFAIWGFQLWLSPWWLERYKQGPLEALWRRLTYGRTSN